MRALLRSSVGALPWPAKPASHAQPASRTHASTFWTPFWKLSQPTVLKKHAKTRRRKSIKLDVDKPSILGPFFSRRLGRQRLPNMTKKSQDTLDKSGLSRRLGWQKLKSIAAESILLHAFSNWKLLHSKSEFEFSAGSIYNEFELDRNFIHYWTFNVYFDLL